MRTVLLASLKHNRRRYVASALAVVLGVAFIVVTNGLAGALRSGMTKDVGLPISGADAVVGLSNSDDYDKLMKAAEEADVQIAPQHTAWISGSIEGREYETRASTVAGDPELQWQEVIDGRMPTREGEVLVGEKFSVARELAVGGDIVISGPGGKQTFEVVGIVDDPAIVGSDVYVRAGDAETLNFWTDVFLVRGDTAWVEASGLETTLWTADEYVDDLQMALTQGIDVISMLVSVFAAIALMVAILVITNTFAILFAQRARDFALLRCVGVTKRQLRRSVRIEALVLGVVASVLGVALGVGLAVVIAAVAASRTDVMGSASFTAPWVVGATVIGILVTVAAAWAPTLAVTRISPLAALRPTEGLDAKSRAGVLRVFLGLLVLAVGVAGLAFSVIGTGGGGDSTMLLLVMLVAGSVSFVGVLLVGPVLVPALIKLLGRVVSRRGSAGAVTRLATSNSVRNPRRTATTTASLMVGVTLTTAMLAGLSSVQASLNAELDESSPLDVSATPTALSTSLAGATGERLLDAARQKKTVEEAILLDGAVVELAGNEFRALAVSGRESVLRGEMGDIFGEAEVLVSFEEFDVIQNTKGVKSTDDGHLLVAMEGPQGTTDVTVEWDSAFGDGVVAVQPAVLKKVAVLEPHGLWARASEGADSGDLLTDMSRVAVEAEVPLNVGGDYENRALFNSQFTVITIALVGLLSIAVVIALIGIANTLGLSVLERAKENALLRAMGLTRQQLRRTLAWEGLLLAAVATVLGVAIGLAFAWVGLEVLVGAASLATNFSVPYWQIVVIAVAACVSGVLASVLPSRKAVKTSPAEGLSAA